MKKVRRKEFFMITALNLAKLSKCASKKVGALIVKEERVISTGYNGTPEGVKNCNEKFDEDNLDREKHHEWSKKAEIHAEMNAIIYAARTGVAIEGATMYVSMEPCNDCIKNLCAAGIKEIFYCYSYDKKEPYPAEIIGFLEANDVKIIQFDPFNIGLNV